MLILIGTVPMAYALNRAPDPAQIVEFKASATAAAEVIEKQAAGYNVIGRSSPGRIELHLDPRDQRRHLPELGRTCSRVCDAGRQLRHP